MHTIKGTEQNLIKILSTGSLKTLKPLILLGFQTFLINSTKNATADFLEGTTASGKTTVGAGVKFMRMVSASRKKLHVIAAKTTGKAEETIIQQDNGILDLHRNARYYGNGDKDYKLPHIKFEGKIINLCFRLWQ